MNQRVATHSCLSPCFLFPYFLLLKLTNTFLRFGGLWREMPL